MRTDADRAYVEAGDHIELYDSRGLSVGLSQTVEDPGNITFWPTQDVEICSWRVAGGDGRSVVAGFDFPMVARRGVYVTIHPVLRLPQPVHRM